MSSQQRAPALFIGHGSPMNTLESNRFTTEWKALAERIVQPTAILAISAHWYVNATAVTAMAHPATIHDFSGFPKELNEFQYPAPGSPELAARVAQLLAPTPVISDDSAWGLDHGTWSVLAQMYPDASIPVVQLSIDASLTPDQHIVLGRTLAQLRDVGVLVLCSGNVVHHLGLLDRSMGDATFEWASVFDAEVQYRMLHDPASLAEVVDMPEWPRAAPTPEHFIPLLYLAGLASEPGTDCEVVVRGGTMGSLTMTSFLVS